MKIVATMSNCCIRIAQQYFKMVVIDNIATEKLQYQ